jgi:hypothetical protein
MAFFNPSNQLLQIDSGQASTYLYNPALGQSVWAGLGENQVLGQRFFGVPSQTVTAVNPSGAPAIYMLVRYSSIAQPAPVDGPAPVYWVDEGFTTVSGVQSENNGLGLSAAAGYLMPNTTSLPNLTAAMLQGSLCLIQVAGYLHNAYGPTTGGGAGNLIAPAAGNWVSTGVAVSATANGISARPFGWQITAISGGLCDVLVNSDVI